MIAVLVDLPGKSHVNIVFTNIQAIAGTMHAAVPDDLVSLQFLGFQLLTVNR